MGRKKEPWKRVGVALPESQLNALDQLPIDRSAAISLCVGYAMATNFLKTVANAPEPGAEEKYCQDCGNVWNTKEESCPNCAAFEIEEPQIDPFAAIAG